MHLQHIGSVFAALAVTATALAIPDSHVAHEERSAHSRRWVKRERVRPEAILPVRIGLAQSNLDLGHEYLMDVSHPSSANYGKHWTADEVIEAFQPSDETVQTVRDWLVQSGIPAHTITHTDNKAWLAFHASTEKVESLLHTTYHEYEDQRTGGVMPSCERYHVPKYIQPHIDYITPGIKLLAPTDELTEAGRELLDKRSWPGSGNHGGYSGGPPSNGGGWGGPPGGFGGPGFGGPGFGGPPGPGGPPSAPWGKPPPKTWWPTGPRPSGGDKYNLSICDIEITPACVAALYHIPPAHLANPENSMGIFEAELQFWDQLDLDLFFTNFTNIPNGTHPIDHNIDGGIAQTTNVSAAGGESMLDLELAYPIVYPQTITVWNVDDIHYQTWANDTYTWGFNTLLDAIDGSYCTYSAYGETGDLVNVDPTYPDPGPGGYNGTLQCGVFKPTNVFSLSYGGQEADVPVAYQKRQCNEFMKLGLQGISFLFASGDSGVGNYPDSVGGTDGPTGCLGPDYNIFNPTWPNGCPYVTNVGATKVYPGHTVFEPESAVYDPAGYPYLVNYSSGGGFSNVYPIPDYQKSAVATFFADHDPSYPYYSGLASVTSDVYALPNVTALAGNTGGIYNRIGRGIPDVAANGDNIATYTGGVFSLSGGTSASTPIFASIINRINEERLAIGKTTLGFLNPTLYAHPEILNDITNGTNAACFEGGFYAVKGWDPVTGLGTPNYPKMLELFLSLP